ncbi:MAG: Cell division protein FtsQ [Alphaproteobacteria bacterium MarineAlpha9_Bin3]|nr:MAG: Cell division protein FtsQ [Alphaproteobacteria bacterium MarineAlpha9_Bin3]|tara:strand:+ start:21616 stop:22338 length:723 start_codon:yes stop_codon:yes gene_type:complete
MRIFKKILLFLLISGLLFIFFKKEFFLDISGQTLKKFSSYSDIVLNEVYLSGRINESKINIIDAIDVSIGELLVNINVKNIRQNLNKLSWVKESSVYLLPMGKLEIEIYEYIPFSRYIDESNTIYLINKDGIKFKKIEDNRFENLFLLYGKDALLNINELPLIINKLNSFNFKVTKIERIDSRRWNIFFKQDFFIKLPNFNALNSLDALYKLDNNIDYNNLTFIDLRIQDRVSLKYKSVD